MNIISKIGTTPFTAAQQRANEPASPALNPTTKHKGDGAVPPALSVSALSVPGSMDTSVIGLSENQLKRQGLECLVAVLRSLVAWGTALNKAPEDSSANSSSVGAPRSQAVSAEDVRRDSMTPEGSRSLDKLSAAGGSAETLRQPTPDITVTDDPGRFESAKQKKTTLLEGIKKFNFKPKRVDLSWCNWNEPHC